MNSLQSIYVVTNASVSDKCFLVRSFNIQYAYHYSCYEKVNISRSIKFRHLFAPFEARNCWENERKIATACRAHIAFKTSSIVKTQPSSSFGAYGKKCARMCVFGAQEHKRVF